MGLLTLRSIHPLQASNGASGQGSIESNQQTIAAPEAAAEATPSSSSRTGPVLALAMAVLAAVLMA